MGLLFLFVRVVCQSGFSEHENTLQSQQLLVQLGKRLPQPSFYQQLPRHVPAPKISPRP